MLNKTAKKITEKNISPSKRKWFVEDRHQSRVEESVKRIRYFLRNQKR
jgi:hypothetical protein